MAKLQSIIDKHFNIAMDNIVEDIVQELESASVSVTKCTRDESKYLDFSSIEIKVSIDKVKSVVTLSKDGDAFFIDGGKDKIDSIASLAKELKKLTKKDDLDEATDVEYARFGKYIKGMITPGTRISDELFDLVDSEGGVHETSIVKFLRSRGGLSTIDQEDVIELEDMIEQCWKQGRRARNLKVSGLSPERYV